MKCGLCIASGQVSKMLKKYLKDKNIVFDDCDLDNFQHETSVRFVCLCEKNNTIIMLQ